MIGQDGDLAYFLKKNGDDSIYENDLGALGSLEMQKVAESITDFINQILQEGKIEIERGLRKIAAKSSSIYSVFLKNF